MAHYGSHEAVVDVPSGDDEIVDEPMSGIVLEDEIWSTIALLRKPARFTCTNSSASVPNPGIYIPNIGTVGLPLSPHDAQEVIHFATPLSEPGTSTTAEASEEPKVWILDQSQVKLQNPAWEQAVAEIVSRVSKSLGVKPEAGEVRAHLSQLVLCEPKSFLPTLSHHKQMEEAFGVLYICLPSNHNGGTVYLRQEDQSVAYDTCTTSRYDTSYIACYTNTTIESKPTSAGYRLMLKYYLLPGLDCHQRHIPTYTGTRGTTERLSALLHYYDTQLKQGNPSLSHFLIYRLKHHYPQFELSLNELNESDALFMKKLMPMATALGFGFYLAGITSNFHYEACASNPDKLQHATSFYEDKVHEDDPRSSYNNCDPESDSQLPRNGGFGNDLHKEKYAVLYHIVDLDGDSMVKDGTKVNTNILHPLASATTKTNRVPGSVLIIVPPSRRVDFRITTDAYAGCELLLLEELKIEALTQPSKTQHIERLCELAVSDTDFRRGLCASHSSPLLPERRRDLQLPVAAAALKVGRLDLFDLANVATSGEAARANVTALGGILARDGLDSMKSRLELGVRGSPRLETKHQFLRKVEKRLIELLPNSDVALCAEFRAWTYQVLLDSVTGDLNTHDAAYLAAFSQKCEWRHYEFKVLPVLCSTTTLSRFAFLQASVDHWSTEPHREQRFFRERVIRHTWNYFTLDEKQLDIERPPVDAGSTRGRFPTIGCPVTYEAIDRLVSFTLEVLPSFTLADHIIPAILAAISTAMKRYAMDSFVLWAFSIIANASKGFELPDLAGTTIPPMHKLLVQTLLASYLRAYVGDEPKADDDYALPARSCTMSDCVDCRKLNAFLTDKHRSTFDFIPHKHLRTHLENVFHFKSSKTPYRRRLLGARDPFTWRITKNSNAARRQRQREGRMDRAAHARRVLQKLVDDVGRPDRVQRYLYPYWDIIIGVETSLFDSLPQPTQGKPAPVLKEISHNVAPYKTDSIPLRKRALDEPEQGEHGNDKRSKFGIN